MNTAKIPLAAKHQGMRVSARGLLSGNTKLYKHLRSEMVDNLEEVARRYYAGDLAAVDEFLQLYCLGEEARKQAVERNGKMETTS